jgi:hypothetical protein
VLELALELELVPLELALVPVLELALELELVPLELALVPVLGSPSQEASLPALLSSS